ncbi:hypothetical protein LP7551_02431 [Roseibium album]|nr:hypothetical protein LP7551_02431 [Roseibium album]
MFLIFVYAPCFVVLYVLRILSVESDHSHMIAALEFFV